MQHTLVSMVKEKVTCGTNASAGIERWLVKILQ